MKTFLFRKYVQCRIKISDTILLIQDCLLHSVTFVFKAKYFYIESKCKKISFIMLVRNMPSAKWHRNKHELMINLYMIYIYNLRNKNKNINNCLNQK